MLDSSEVNKAELYSKYELFPIEAPWILSKYIAPPYKPLQYEKLDPDMKYLS